MRDTAVIQFRHAHQASRSVCPQRAAQRGFGACEASFGAVRRQRRGRGRSVETRLASLHDWAGGRSRGYAGDVRGKPEPEPLASNYRKLNEAFYQERPSDYFLQRLVHLAVVASDTANLPFEGADQSRPRHRRDSAAEGEPVSESGADVCRG
jgi:hypothetical protein